jgi:hypothetical protein
MPARTTKKRAAEKRRQGKRPTTQAGEFVREEMHHKKSGKHGKMSRKQAIAIGLSKARRAGVKVPKRPGRAPSASRRGASKSSRSSRRHARR